MRRKISDSVVVITGASSGINRATALRLAGQGAAVVLASRQEEALKEVAQQCEQAGGCPLPVKTDVTDEEQVKHLARRAIEAYGRIDVWINGAAVTMLARFEDTPADAFRRVIETNFFGYVHGARTVLPYFRQQGYGTLINISSVLSKIGAPYESAYAASKFAVSGFSESLRMELRDAPGIHVCTILPATIDTPLFQKAANFTGRAVQAMPPVYAPEEVAETILHTILHPQREVVVGNTRRIVALRRLAPALAERMIAAKVDQQQFQNKPSPVSTGNLFEPMPQFNAVHGGWRQEHETSGKQTAWAAGAVALLAVGTVICLARNQRGARSLQPAEPEEAAALI